MQNNLKTFEEIEKTIDVIAERQQIQGIITWKLFRDYLHFFIYAHIKNQYYNKQSSNSNSLYNLAQNYKDETVIDGRDFDQFYRRFLDEYKKIIQNKPNCDNLKPTTGTEGGRNSYSLPKQDFLIFDCILKLNSTCDNTNTRSTYRKYCLQKFSSIAYLDMEELYHYFCNNVNNYSDVSIKNLESYKLESAMRFETIKYALSKITEFELNSSKENLEEKMDSVYKIMVQIMKYTPSPFRKYYIDYFCKAANEMNDNNMHFLQYELECNSCIQADMKIFLGIFVNTLDLVSNRCNEEIASLGLKKYSQIFGYSYFKNNLSMGKDFHKKHYKSLMKAFEEQYLKDKEAKK